MVDFSSNLSEKRIKKTEGLDRRDNLAYTCIKSDVADAINMYYTGYEGVNIFGPVLEDHHAVTWPIIINNTTAVEQLRQLYLPEIDNHPPVLDILSTNHIHFGSSSNARAVRSKTHSYPMILSADDLNELSSFHFSTVFQSPNVILHGVNKRIMELRKIAEEDEIIWSKGSESSLKEFLVDIGAQIVPSVFLSKEGTLRAVWKNHLGEQVAAHFVGENELNLVLFIRRSEAMIARYIARDTPKAAASQIKSLGLLRLLAH